MRGIKYRIWDYDKQEMIYPDSSILIVLNTEGNYYTWNVRGDQDIFTNIELMQYTGLKDKNGNEICEGDIIKILSSDENFEREGGERMGLIYWAEGTASFAIDWGNNATFGLGAASSYEIIGNRFESHELV